MQQPPLIEFRDVVKQYGRGEATIRALDGVSLSIRENRWSTKRATRWKRFEFAGQLKATSAVGTAIVATCSPGLIRFG